jgi:nicotinate-nucleotide pyrophosphorylase (carboxylating)
LILGVYCSIPKETQATASFVAKAEGTIAGLYVATIAFQHVDTNVKVSWLVSDGDVVKPGQTLGVLTGPAHAILIGERIALNYMQRMSGIATQTASMVREIGCCTRTKILDTRKTVPGLRLLDKWAVKIGGGENHRIGLYDMMMIKDNHIASAGGIKQAVSAAEQFMRENNIIRPLEVETRTLDEVKEILNVIDRAGESSLVTRIMLDNMVKKDCNGVIDVDMLREALDLIGDRAIETEASGNVTLATVKDIARTGVQFISTGAITHSVTALDISLIIQTK